MAEKMQVDNHPTAAPMGAPQVGQGPVATNSPPEDPLVTALKKSGFNAQTLPLAFSAALKDKEKLEKMQKIYDAENGPVVDEYLQAFYHTASKERIAKMRSEHLDFENADMLKGAKEALATFKASHAQPTMVPKAAERETLETMTGKSALASSGYYAANVPEKRPKMEENQPMTIAASNVPLQVSGTMFNYDDIYAQMRKLADGTLVPPTELKMLSETTRVFSDEELHQRF